MSEINVFGEHREGDPLGSVVICTRDHLNAATATAMWTTDFSWVPPGYSVNRQVIQGGILTLQRNEALKRMEGAWLLFIDDDMIWQFDAVGRLVASWAEVQEQFEEPVMMGGLCHRRQAPFDPTLYAREQPTSGRYRFMEKWDSDIVEVDATGCAFLLIPERVLDAIMRHAGSEWPDPEKRSQMLPPPIFRWDGMFGEDLTFCQDAKAAGCRIFVDTRIEIGHIAEVTIGRQDFIRQIALRDMVTEERVREANDKVGLPTMTAREARLLLGWD